MVDRQTLATGLIFRTLDNDFNPNAFLLLPSELESYPICRPVSECQTAA